MPAAVWRTVQTGMRVFVDAAVDVRSTSGILCGVVALDEYERKFRGTVQQLTGRGWSRADLAGLFTDWPDMTLDGSGLLVYAADELSRSGANPDETRGWLRVLFRVDGGFALLAESVRAWLASRGIWDRAYSTLVEQYVKAARGDHEIALLAYRAGLEPQELSGLVVWGRCDKTALAVQAALREMSAAWRNR